MSLVTNLILHVPSQVDDRLIKSINAFFGREGAPGLVSVEPSGMPKRWQRDARALECDLYVGAFNYLPLDSFLCHLATCLTEHDWQGAPWEADCVQLFVMEQEDETFRILAPSDFEMARREVTVEQSEGDVRA